ncbi:CLK4-associating serine/arginine rich protein-like [Palaemon carinicauda]|uniref:CLK4-associating serine/arginine rich protein-like n=1 Tax=Palaemon carinicauda TaxID=392227 RepID=UPI0035B58D53
MTKMQVDEKAGKVCSSSDTYPECVGWSDIQWVHYGTKKRKSSKRSPRKASVSSPLPSPSERSDGASVSPSPTQSRGRGSLAGGDNQGKLGSAGSDAFGWKLPKTPGRSPMRMEEGLDSWFPSVGRQTSFPTPLTEVPEEFLQPSTSGTQRVAKSPAVPAPARRTVSAVTSGSSEESFSSGEEARMKHRRRRERSRSRRSRSRSRSRYSRKRSRSPRRKHKRSRSRDGDWVFVPRKAEIRCSPDRRSKDFSPRRPSSKHGYDPRRQIREKDSTCRHKTAKPPVHPVQRGEPRFLTDSLAEPAQLVRPSDRKERFPLSGQPTGSASSSPRELERTLVLTESAMPVLTPAPGAEASAGRTSTSAGECLLCQEQGARWECPVTRLPRLKPRLRLTVGRVPRRRTRPIEE